MEREVGGGIGMGNICKSMADSFQCMTKPTTIKKKKRKEKKKRKSLPYLHLTYKMLQAHFACFLPCLRISCFSKEFWFLSLKNCVRN